MCMSRFFDLSQFPSLSPDVKRTSSDQQKTLEVAHFAASLYYAACRQGKAVYVATATQL